MLTCGKTLVIIIYIFNTTKLKLNVTQEIWKKEKGTIIIWYGVINLDLKLVVNILLKFANNILFLDYCLNSNSPED